MCVHICSLFLELFRPVLSHQPVFREHQPTQLVPRNKRIASIAGGWTFSTFMRLFLLHLIAV